MCLSICYPTRKVINKRQFSFESKINEIIALIFERNEHKQNVIYKLLESLNKFEIEYLSSDYGRNLLHFAVIYENEKLVSRLLSRRINIDIKDTKGGSALHYALQTKNIKIIRLIGNYENETSESKWFCCGFI